MGAREDFAFGDGWIGAIAVMHRDLGGFAWLRPCAEVKRVGEFAYMQCD